MKKATRGCVWRGVQSALIASIATLVCLNSIPLQQAVGRPFGRLTRQDIARRSREMIQIGLMPADAEMTIRPLSCNTGKRESRSIWYADYSDGAGEFAGHVHWDADTGELLVLSRKTRASRVPLPALTRWEAMAHAWRVLKQTGIGMPAERWAPFHAPASHGNIWHIAVISAQKLAFVNIDRRTDQVLYVHIMARRSASWPR